MFDIQKTEKACGNYQEGANEKRFSIECSLHPFFFNLGPKLFGCHGQFGKQFCFQKSTSNLIQMRYTLTPTSFDVAQVAKWMKVIV